MEQIKEMISRGNGTVKEMETLAKDQKKYRRRIADGKHKPKSNALTGKRIYSEEKIQNYVCKTIRNSFTIVQY